MITSKEILTVREAGELAGVSDKTIREWIKTGRLPSTPTSDGDRAQHRINRQDLVAAAAPPKLPTPVAPPAPPPPPPPPQPATTTTSEPTPTPEPSATEVPQ